jgi:Na+-translocating ferredoxin:NAD+ oxidoreductase RNF subunit RnfB
MNYLFLAQLNITEVLIVVAIMAVLAVVFTILMVTVSKICHVEEDKDVVAVTEHLAGANCGGCGYAGCGDFAKALKEGKANLSSCNATSNDQKQEIAKILNVPFTASAKVFAVVKCAAGDNCIDKFSYVGGQNCTYQTQYMGGKKACTTACLGGGNCLEKCTNNAVEIKGGVAVIDKALCGGCGACKINCPKGVIEFIPTTAKVYVACSSLCRGKDVMNVCSVGCIGCGLCAKNCPENAISMVNNLPVIDYDKCCGCKTCVAKCPRKTIKEI